MQSTNWIHSRCLEEEQTQEEAEENKRGCLEHNKREVPSHLILAVAAQSEGLVSEWGRKLNRLRADADDARRKHLRISGHG
jgi:hypothetical protein